MSEDFWQVPKGKWDLQRCFILGGGPSLNKIDMEVLAREDCKIIAINDAFLKFPTADVLYFSDLEWLQDNIADVAKHFRGEYIVSRMYVPQIYGANLHRPVLRIARDMSVGLSRHPAAVSGWCSGANAINLAYLFGASMIVLLGFDMQGLNWHTRHKTPKKEDCYNRDFIPAIKRMAAELDKEDTLIFNCCMDSALTCFPKMSFADVLCL